MAEERRVFYRIGSYALLVAPIYWFVSYEVAGTVLLGATAIACVALAVMLGRNATEPHRTVVQRAKDVATFEDERGPEVQPLVLAEQAFPTLSLQPPLVGLAAGAIATGLVFGAWLWVPGAVLFAAGCWRWFTELDTARGQAP